ncbi:glycosyltransferase family 2 protein [Desulfovibrio cuneatus]|uniref:glycosyltransferase family 2 protein n=1 Tax=Desulfovibrio cuneatus TaxID=159728 RepID=UPI000685AE8F|nr:glycosyltransferase family 2 protein [Desulfovibrio cuneatus]
MLRCSSSPHTALPVKETRSHHPVLSIVSPIHCEELGLGAFLDKIQEVLITIGLSYEIVLVDDGSTDNSWLRMQEEFHSRPFLRCLRLSRNFGKEAAMAAGLNAANGQAIITLDSDLQHPPECIVEMVRLWQQGDADVVEAQKSVRQKESFFSRLFAQSFYSVFALVTPFNLKNASDFKLMDRKALNAWKQLSERRVFFRGMSTWLGFRQKIVYFEPHERHSGTTQWSFLAKLMLALDSLSAYTTRLLFLVWGLTGLFGLFALAVAGEALWMKFHGSAMSGFTTVILLILISTAAILISICLLSLYIRQIFHEVKGRPLYLVSENLENSPKSVQEHTTAMQRRRWPIRPLSRKIGLRRGKGMPTVQRLIGRPKATGKTPYNTPATAQPEEAHALPTPR